jgi:hypothetical protein
MFIKRYYKKAKHISLCQYYVLSIQFSILQLEIYFRCLTYSFIHITNASLATPPLCSLFAPAELKEKLILYVRFEHFL